MLWLATRYAVTTWTEYCAFLVLLDVKAKVIPQTRDHICISYAGYVVRSKL